MYFGSSHLGTVPATLRSIEASTGAMVAYICIQRDTRGIIQNTYIGSNRGMQRDNTEAYFQKLTEGN